MIYKGSKPYCITWIDGTCGIHHVPAGLQELHSNLQQLSLIHCRLHHRNNKVWSCSQCGGRHQQTKGYIATHKAEFEGNQLNKSTAKRKMVTLRTDLGAAATHPIPCSCWRMVTQQAERLTGDVISCVHLVTGMYISKRT